MGKSESRLSEEAWEQWLTPFSAIKRLIEAGLEDREHAVNWLIARLQSGELRGAGTWCTFDDELEASDDFIQIWPPKVWSKIQALGSKHDFWISGNYHDSYEDIMSDGILPFGCLFSQVRFQPNAIADFCLQAGNESIPLTTLETPATKQSGGRPPKPFWDRLWAAITAQIYNGDWRPDKQSDIEKAMHDWLVLNNESAGETAVRAKAKLLWLALNDKAEN